MGINKIRLKYTASMAEKLGFVSLHRTEIILSVSRYLIEKACEDANIQIFICGGVRFVRRVDMADLVEAIDRAKQAKEEHLASIHIEGSMAALKKRKQEMLFKNRSDDTIESCGE